MIDLEAHKRNLHLLLLEDPNSEVPVKCMTRMDKGKSSYERPGFVDNRNYLDETADEILDGINYIAMEYTKLQSVGDLRRFRLTQACMKLRQAYSLLRDAR